MWKWIKNVYNKFNDWVASWAPGFKNLVVCAVGAIGSVAATLQDYITGMPLESFIGATKALIVTGVLFSLAFWFKMISNRA